MSEVRTFEQALEAPVDAVDNTGPSPESIQHDAEVVDVPSEERTSFEDLFTDDESTPEVDEPEQEPEQEEHIEDADAEDEDSDEEQPELDEEAEVDNDSDEEEQVPLTDETTVFEYEGKSVSLKEAQDGYLRREDYTQKTQAVAEQKKELDTVQATLATEAVELAKHLNLAQSEDVDTLKKYDGTDWARMSRENKGLYAKHKPVYDALVEKTNKRETVLKGMTDKASTEMKAHQAKQGKATIQRLTKDVPNFNEQMYKDALKHAVEMGMPQQMASGITDYGSMRMILNSMQVMNAKKGVATKSHPKSKAVLKTQSQKGKATRAPSKVKQKVNPNKSGKYSSDAGRKAFADIL
jgi:hypothetical protein